MPFGKAGILRLTESHGNSHPTSYHPLHPGGNRHGGRPWNLGSADLVLSRTPWRQNRRPSSVSFANTLGPAAMFQLRLLSPYSNEVLWRLRRAPVNSGAGRFDSRTRRHAATVGTPPSVRHVGRTQFSRPQNKARKRTRTDAIPRWSSRHCQAAVAVRAGEQVSADAPRDGRAGETSIHISPDFCGTS